MDAGYRNLLVARTDRDTDVVKHAAKRPASSRPTGLRNDAVTASFVAAGLDAQRQCGPAGDAWFECAPARSISGPEPVCGRERDVIGDNCRERLLAIVGNDAHDVGQRPDFIGAPCRVATSHDHAGSRIVTRNAPDRLARSLVGRGGHRAAVHDHEVSFMHGRDNAAAGAKVVLDDQRIGLVDATTEGNHGVLHSGIRDW
jgi:hypothetical protein